MDRQIVYPGALPRSYDFSQAQQNTGIALGWLAQSVLGGTTWCAGLACSPTVPASFAVNVAPGALGQIAALEQTAFGAALPADTSDPLVKVGVNIAPVVMAALAAPTGSGTSQSWLLEGQMAEVDGTPAVLGYVNPAMPTQPFAGPNNSGAAQNTQRTQRVALQWVAGAPSTTGTQVVPPVTAGWTPLAVVTLANGATSIGAANIVAHPAAPFVDPLGLGRGILPGRLIGTRVYVPPGVPSYIPTLGTNSIMVEVLGGGGSGGGSAATGANQVSAGSGGGGGGYARRRLTSGFAGQTITVGYGGATQPINAGGAAGGASSFGNLMTATGGAGGELGPALAAAGYPYGSGLGGSGVGGDVNVVGGIGLFGFYTQPATSGKGGGSFYGEGALYVTGSANGTAAVSPGAGGSGGAQSTASAPGSAGAAGANGLVIVWEYS